MVKPCLLASGFALAIGATPKWDQLVAKVNGDAKRTWTAVTPSDRDLSRAIDLKGGLRPFKGTLPPTKTFLPRATGLPQNYDARSVYPQCSSIATIRDQCGCGSCFAFGAVEAFEDRICIHTGKNVTLSVGDIIQCHTDENMSCDGGNPISVWQGIFAGSSAGDGAISDSCYPYGLDTCPCNHHSLNSSLPQCKSGQAAPTCNFMQKFACEDEGIYRAEQAWLIQSSNMEQELVENGPITVAFHVFDDFLTYSSGVYQQSPDAEFLGGHSVKIVGYGIDQGTKYWLVANSWNDEFGEGGFFRISRGTDECGIESQAVVAGMPVSSTVSV